MTYTVYILFSKVHDQIYIGHTSNLLQRFLSHNSLSKKGHTVKYRPWTVIYCEYFDNKQQASLREKQLKGGQSRKQIKEKIEQQYQSHKYIIL